jgi:hypothetical protein
VKWRAGEETRYWTTGSSSSDNVWRTSLWPDGTVSCNCPGWTRHAARHCKHLDKYAVEISLAVEAAQGGRKPQPVAPPKPVAAPASVAQAMAAAAAARAAPVAKPKRRGRFANLEFDPEKEAS